MHVGLLPDFYGQQQTAAMTTCIIIVAFAVASAAVVFVGIPFMVFIVFSSHVWAHTAAQPCTTRTTPVDSPISPFGT